MISAVRSICSRICRFSPSRVSRSTGLQNRLASSSRIYCSAIRPILFFGSRSIRTSISLSGLKSGRTIDPKTANSRTEWARQKSRIASLGMVTYGFMLLMNLPSLLLQCRGCGSSARCRGRGWRRRACGSCGQLYGRHAVRHGPVPSRQRRPFYAAFSRNSTLTYSKGKTILPSSVRCRRPAFSNPVTSP